MQILSERMSWGKMQGTKPLQGARCKEGGGYRRNRDRPNDTPGRGLPWPRSMQAAWAAAQEAGASLSQFAKGISKASGDLVSATTARRYVEGKRTPTTYPCREAIRRALNFTDAELPAKVESDLPSAAFKTDYPNAADMAYQRLLERAAHAFWPDGPPHDVRRPMLYEARVHAGELQYFSDCF